MRKLLIRSKSESDWFKDKENLDIINNNLRKFKKIKVNKEDSEKRDNIKHNTLNVQRNNISHLDTIKSKTLKLKQRISLFEVAKQDLQNKNSIVSNEKDSSDETSDKKQNYYENNFKDYVKKILKFKLEFDRNFFEKEINTNKNLVDMNLEIILNILRNFKEKQLEKIDLENANLSLSLESEDSSFDSPDLSQSKIKTKNDQKRKNSQIRIITEIENFIENLEKFEQIIEILIKTSPEDLFREVKSIILNEYESTINQIKHYLELNKNESSKKFLTCISANILFIISTITYKLDYYTITVNSLVEKLNKFFIHFVENTKDSNKFVKNLDLVQKFVKIKKTFIKDFLDNKQKIPEEITENSINTYNSLGSGADNSTSGITTIDNFQQINSNEKLFYNFALDKFCSFGRYFFNNIFSLLDYSVNIDPYVGYLKGLDYRKLKDEKGCYINIYKKKIENRKDKILFIWKNKNKKSESERNKLILDKYFRMFLNSKLASWKYATIQPGVKKMEICRICETNFEINEFVLHLNFCKDIRMNNQGILNIKQEMKKIIGKLKDYRESILKDKTNLKDIFFSPKSDFNQVFRMHVLERTPLILNKMKLESNQNNNYFLFNKLGERANQMNLNLNKNIPLNTSEVEFLDKIILTFTKESDLSREYYEKFPYKLAHLISIVHFTIYIFFQNKNSPKYNQDLNEIFARLFALTMKKLNLIENILSLNNSKENARMKIKNNTKNNLKEKGTPKDKEEKKIDIEKEKGKDSISKDTKLIFQNIDSKKNIPTKKLKNLNKNFLEIENPKQELNNKNKGTNYLAQFTSIKNANSSNIPVIIKEKDKIYQDKLEESNNEKNKQNKLYNEKNDDQKKNINNEINQEDMKKHEENSDDKIVKRAYCGPYMNTRNFKSSQETFKSNFKKRVEILSQIKEKDETKNEADSNINKLSMENMVSQSENLEGNKKPIPNIFSKNKIQDKSIDDYVLKISAQFTNLPMTTRMLKKDSLKDFCEMLDLTKSKLQTRRILNKNDSNFNSNQSKMYLQTLASKKVDDNIDSKHIEVNKPLNTTRKNIVKLVSSELKNLTKLGKNEFGIANTNENNIYNSNNNKNFPISYPNVNSEKICNSSNSLENLNMKKTVISINNNLGLFQNVDDLEKSNSEINCNNTNSTNINNFTNLLLNNTNQNTNTLLLTPNNITKNNSILKKSLFDKTPSPNIIAIDERLDNRKDSENLYFNKNSNKNFKQAVLNKEKENLESNSSHVFNRYKANEDICLSSDTNISDSLRKIQSLEFNEKRKIDHKFNKPKILNHSHTTCFKNNFKRNDNFKLTLNPDHKSENHNESIKKKFGLKMLNSLQLENCEIKNEIFTNKMSKEDVDEYYTGSIKFLPEEKESHKTINSEYDLHLKNLYSEINSNILKKKSSSSYLNLGYNMSFNKSDSALDSSCSLDSEINYPQSNENKKINNQESLVNEINDDVDSQFDEMIELMDDIQLSDPYKENDNEIFPTEVKPNAIKISDFKLMNEISKGGYGRVDIFKKISTGDIYAIKTVDIKKMKSKNISGLLKNEALIMNEIYSEYVVKCYYIFNDDKNYYYVMEYMSGGDLHNFLNEYSLGFETIQFIISEVILALEYLHSKNIIHRDMKPENIVISSNGHFKLTDFGISEIGLLHNKYAITNKINTEGDNQEEKWVDSGKILGTQNYMAPEVIKCEKITSKTDYWSVGVILYELFTNKTPFYNGNLEEVFDNILNLNIDWQTFDQEVENEKIKDIAKDLIQKFLVIDPAKRWGDTNIDKIKSHKFFENFDWQNVKSMKNLLVLKHVAEKIKQSKQVKIPAAKPLNKINEEDENKNSNKFVNNRKGKNESGKSDKKDSNRITDNIENENNKDFIDKDEFNLFYSERIDNLNKKNEDVLKTNIKLKKIEIDTDDFNFTNLMHDLD